MSKAHRLKQWGAPQVGSWAVPAFKVCAAVFIFSALAPRPPFDGSTADLPWRALAIIACITTLWFPAVGALLTLPLAAALPYGSFIGFGIIPMTVLAMVAAYRWRWRAIFLLAAAAAVALAHDLAVIGKPPRTIIAAGGLLLAFLVGVWIRNRIVKAQHRQRQVEASRRAVTHAREEERVRLAHELAALLTHSLRAISDSLRRAAAEDPVAAHHTFEQVADIGRASLAQLRLLVTTLRAPSTSSGLVDLAAATDWFEDELTSHGLQVEWEGTGPGSATAPDLMRSFLRVAAGRILQDAPAGSVCVATLDARGTVVRLELDYPIRPGAHPPIFPVLEERIVHVGGSLGVSHDDLAHVTLELPQHTITVDEMHSDNTLDGWRRALTGLGLGGAALFLVNLALALLRGDGSWPMPLQWALICVAVCLSPLGRRFTVALLAAVVALSYFWPGQHFWVGTPGVVALTIATGFLASRGPLTVPLLVGAWAAYGATTSWPGNVTALDGVLLSWLGIGFGISACFFLTVRIGQMSELERLEAARQEQQTQERRHLARELHDLVAHQLSQITLQLPPGPTTAKAQTVTIEHLTRTAQSATRDLATLLARLYGEERAACDPCLQDTVRGASEALEEAGHTVIVTIGGDLEQLDSHGGQTLSRVIWEGSTNAIRYAPPGSPVHIIIGHSPGVVSARLISQLPAQARTSPHSTGTGLLGLRERVELTHGLFSAGESGGSWVLHAELAVESSGSR